MKCTTGVYVAISKLFIVYSVVLNIYLYCSIFGHKVSPGAGAHFYSATKFALRAVTEGIRVELRNMKSGIKVTVRKFVGGKLCVTYCKL